MKTRKIVLTILILTIVVFSFGLRRPLLFLVLARPATSAEIHSLLGPPSHLLSPTGWHATPSWATGYVHRWKTEMPVGQWYGYFKTEIAEGWIRSHFDLDGSRVGGFTLFAADGRIEYQWQANQPTTNSPPWLWGEKDLTEEEMATPGAVMRDSSR